MDNNDEWIDDWVDALTHLDMFIQKEPWGPKTHKEAVAPLCKLFRDQRAELSPDVREYLADLIERVELCRPKGRQKVPTYTISEANQNWYLAIKSAGPGR
jgi:hypothetical protein